MKFSDYFKETLDRIKSKPSRVSYEDLQRLEADGKATSPDAQKSRVRAIMNSNKPMIAKLREIAYNPYSKVNIVDYIIENGTEVINMIDLDLLEDENGNTFVDFVDSDNNFYFRALEENLPQAERELTAYSPYEDIVFIKNVKFALDLWETLNDIEDCFTINDYNDVDSLVEKYQKVEAFVITCAQYLSERGVPKQTVKRYKEDQMIAYQDFFSENLPAQVLLKVQRRVM